MRRLAHPAEGASADTWNVSTGHSPAPRLAERVWAAVGGDPTAARLDAPTLLLPALAEIHANAPMFGSLDSESFKIKAKRLARRGKQALAAIKGE